jgi:hypothetical protein
MRHSHYTLHGHDVQEHAAGLIDHYIGISDYSAKCPKSTLFHVLFAAAAHLVSIFAACMHLRHAPSRETLRKALLATLPDYATLQQRVNRALVGDLPKPLRKRKQCIAIDLHLVPYYGEPDQDLKEIYRSKATDGTNNFHAYASAYVVYHGQRFTVALTPVEQGESMKTVVQRLLALAAKAGVRPRLLLLDRGFYAVEVIRYLQAARVPFLMPAVARGKKPKAGEAATGIRAYKLYKEGGWGQHTLASGKNKATVLICVYCGNYRGRWQKHGRFAWVYAYWGIKPQSGHWVAETYRLRFGIETSYRQLEEGRIKTCTRQPKIRFFYVAVAMILRNVWVWLHWEVLSSPHRGRRRLCLERLRLKEMLLWLLLVAESALGVRDQILTERPPKCKVKVGRRI